MKVLLLSYEEQIALRATHLLVVTHEDLTQTATATAQALSAMTLPVGTIAAVEGMKLAVPFKDAADTDNNSCSLTIGDGGTANLFVASTEVNANGSFVSYSIGTGTRKAYTAADALKVTFGAPPTGKTLAAFTAGELHLFVRLIDLVKASKAEA